MITYEYPFNERARTLLRLEDFFAKISFFVQQEDPREHLEALLTLLEILEVAGRTDMKMDLIQELERQRHTLLSYRNNPDISEEALSGALYEIEQSSTSLLTLTGKLGQHLRENEWLMSIKSRAAIPGGLCQFDLPSLHYWQGRSPEERRETILNWLKPMLPLKEGISIVLRFLRSSGHPEHKLAEGGHFQQMLGGMVSQMVRVQLPQKLAFVPEVSANKYALNIRFLPPDIEHRSRQLDHGVDVSFDLAFCNF